MEGFNFGGKKIGGLRKYHVEKKEPVGIMGSRSLCQCVRKKEKERNRKGSHGYDTEAQGRKKSSCLKEKGNSAKKVTRRMAVYLAS